MTFPTSLGLSRRRFNTALGAFALTPTLSEAVEDRYPNRPIEMVIPFTPGGATDIVMRVLQPVMSQALGQPLIVLNRPGGSTNIGTLSVVRAKPDGLTLLVGGRNLTTNAALFSTMPYSPSKDLKPITMTTNTRVLLLASPALPVNSVAELMTYIRQRPGQLNYASYGAGSTPHLAAELFQSVTGTKLTHIPYSGNSPAVIATIRNEAQVLFTTATTVVEFIQDGRLKPLAIDGDGRSALFPNLPTFKESGVDFQIGSWFGLLAPAETPDAVIDKVWQAARQALQEPQARAIFARQGTETVGSSPSEFKKFLELETVQLSALIKASNIKLD